MKKVFIKYNPYKLETEVTVDGKKLAQNSKLGEKIVPGTRLQEWVEELPRILIDEYNDEEFDVVFHGTLLDYEDLTEVFNKAYENGELKAAKLERKPAKETSDKEVLIDKIFEKIQNGPFEELKDADIINAFENAKSSDFEVCVVATMSAGKSTLINSMLRNKLMPSKQEACTAIVTQIKDNDNNSWEAEVYNKDNKMIESYKELNYKTMERLNSDENVSLIKASGNIPFVTSEDVSLVLIDTPGPNNSRDPEHKKVQSEFLSKSSKSLVLYIMEGTFGSDDDNALLQRVADSMAVGGKQSKDRFIFVVNKMDDRKKEDGSTEETLNRIRAYLKKHGIENPNIFPTAALTALNIRLIENKSEIDEDSIDETEVKVRKLNRNENLHLENFASLPLSMSGKIKEELSKAIENKDVNEQALIHTGVPSVEAAIRQYVKKYAKTAKIKNIVDTFTHKLDEVGCFEETKHELAKRQDESKKIVEQILKIREKIDNIKTAKKFKDAVDDAVIKVNDDSEEVIDGIVTKFQGLIIKEIDGFKGKESEVDEAKKEVEYLIDFAKKLEPTFEVELDELIRDNLVNIGNALLDEYKNKLKELTEEIDTSTLGITIDPLKLMEGSFNIGDSFSLEEMTQTKKVEDGEEWVRNKDKRWYKPWTWFQEKGYYRTKYKNVKYVKADEMADELLRPVEDGIYENGDLALKYVRRQSNIIVKEFKNEFEKLDNILKGKLSELESFATDKEKAEQRICESEHKLKWLKSIKEEIESILEI